MNSIVHQMTVLYVLIADFLAQHPNLADWRQSHNQEAAFTDAEVLTIALMQGCLGVATLKGAYGFIAENHRDAFPKLCSYKRFIARLHPLLPLVGSLVRAALAKHRMPGRVYLIDSKPIPLCKPIRHGRVRLLREEGAYYGKNSVGWFFGFKVHVLAHKQGEILGAVLTGGNISDKDQNIVALLVQSVCGGLSLADLGYRSKELRAWLKAEFGMGLLTPADAGKHRLFLSQMRERVETTFSALWDRFIDRVLSRSWLGLWNTILLKILHFNLCKAGILV